MTRFVLAFLALACGGCSEAAAFRGPATYVVSRPNGPPLSGAMDQRGLLCANMLAGEVFLRLGEKCVLFASPSRYGHAATIAGGSRCVLPFPEGPQEVVVRTGWLVADAAKGIDVTIGAELVASPGAYVAYRLNAGPMQMNVAGCSELVEGAPSDRAPAHPSATVSSGADAAMDGGEITGAANATWSP